MPTPLTEAELLKMLKEEEADAASYHTSELAKAQAESLERFNGDLYGDEVEGRSKITTQDIRDCINWIMPDLMRTFGKTEDTVTITPGSKEDEAPYDGKSGKPKTECAANLMNHVFWKDNDGAVALYDFAFDGLLSRRGVMRCGWRDPEPKPPMLLEGVSPEKLAKYLEDPEYEILEQDEDKETGTFSLKVKRTPKFGRPDIEAVASENFRISRRAKSVEAADYHSEGSEEFLAEMIRKWPQLADKLNPDGVSAASNETSDEESDPRAEARWSDETTNVAEKAAKHAARRKVKLLREYIKVDFDGDGIVELRHVKRVGDVIVENIAVEESEYVTWTPLRISHKDAGNSLADVLMPIQRARTVVLRKTLDGLAQALTPRQVVNTQMIGAEAVDDILDNEIGGVIRSTGDVGQAYREVVTPDVSGSGYQMLEYLDQRGEVASGNLRHNQGMDPEALNKTATGIDLLQAAGKSRVEMIAFWLGKGLEKVFQRTLKLLAAHQDKPRQLKIAGEWIDIDPRTWSDEMSVSIHVGMAGSSRATQIANLALVSEKQEQIIATAGPSNPLVPIGLYRNTLARMAEAMGFKDPSQFYAEIPEGYAPPEPAQPQDPKVIAEQTKQMTAMADAKLREQEAAHKQQIAQFEAQTAREAALAKVAEEGKVAVLRAQAEAQLAAERFAFERELAEAEFREESQLNRKRQADDAEIKKLSAKNTAANGKANGKSAMKKNRPGGDLAK